MKIAEGEKSSGGSVSLHSVEDGKIIFTDGLGENAAPVSHAIEVLPVVLKGTTPELLAEPEVEVVLSSVQFKEAGNDAMGYAVGRETPAEVVVKPKKLVSKPVESKIEIVPTQEGRLPLPQKGDVYENTLTGETIFVQGFQTRQDMPGVLYTEMYPGGSFKNDGRYQWRSTEGFGVLICGEEMRKNDPIKEKHSEFYAEYEKQMKVAVDAFTREAYSNSVAMEAWEEYIEEEYGSFLRGESKDPEKEKMAKEELEHLQRVEKIVDAIVEKWNKIDRYIVEQGRQGLLLLAEIHAVEALLPDYVLELKVSELKLLEEQQGFDKPDIELVEKGYQRILLGRKVKAIEGKYNQFIARNEGTYQDMRALDVFKDEIDTLSASVSDISSLEDVKGALSEIVEIEEQMFVKKKTQESDGQKRRKQELSGGLVKQGKKKGNKEEVRGNNHNNKGDGRRTSAKRITASLVNESGEKSRVRSFNTRGQRQENGVFSSEQQEEAQELMGQVDETIQEELKLAKNLFEDPTNDRERSSTKYRLHVEFLNGLGRKAEDLLADVKIAGLQSILEKVKGVKFKLEEFTAPKKVIEVPTASVAEKLKERSFEDLLKNLGRNSEEISFRESFLNDALSAGREHIQKEMEFGDEDMKKFVSENKEDLIENFSQGIIACFFDLPSWTLSEKELFARILVRKYFEEFVK